MQLRGCVVVRNRIYTLVCVELSKRLFCRWHLLRPGRLRRAKTGEAFFARPPGQKSSHSSERLLRDRARLHSALLFTCRDATMAMQLLSERPQDTLFRVPLEAHLHSAVCLSLNSPLCLYFCTHRAPLQGATEVVSRFMPLCLAAHRDPPPPRLTWLSVPRSRGTPGCWRPCREVLPEETHRAGSCRGGRGRQADENRRQQQTEPHRLRSSSRRRQTFTGFCCSDF